VVIGSDHAALENGEEVFADYPLGIRRLHNEQ
jgi:hypothetical protein